MTKFRVPESLRRAMRLGLLVPSPQASYEARDINEICEMKSNLRLCGVTEEEIEGLESKYGKWDIHEWVNLYQHYMVNGDFYKKRNFTQCSLEDLLKASYVPKKKELVPLEMLL